VLALHPQVRGVAALMLVGLLALAVAGLIEALQTFLPPRVPSNIDLATNVGGALLGAAAGLPAASPLIDRGRLAQWRARWFTREASPLLVILLLWPLAQTYPGSMLFGNGRILPAPAWAASSWSPFGGTAGDAFGPAEFVLAEAFTVTAALVATSLALAGVQTAHAPRKRLLLAFVALTLAAKAFWYAVLFGPERSLIWLTPGAVGGLAIGLFTVLVAAHGTARALTLGSLAAAALWLLTVNLVPDNPYHVDSLAAYRPGRLVHFNALSRWLSLAWPFALLAVLALVHLLNRRLPR
jgi:hypothetical protein